MFLSSNKIIKSIIKIKAQNFDNKNKKKQKIKQKHEAQKISYYILSYLAFIKVMFLLLNTKLYSFIDKKNCEEFPLIVIIKFIIFISI